MAIKIVPNNIQGYSATTGEKRPVYTSPEQAQQARSTMVELGGMSAVPKELVDRAALANPPSSVLKAVSTQEWLDKQAGVPGTRSGIVAAELQIDPESYDEWARSQGLDPAAAKPIDKQRWLDQKNRRAFSGGVR